MAGGKQSPRQKMINMMYLVLTAMLALNISKDILEAFVLVNEGMVVQKMNIESVNGRLYSDFDEQKMLFPGEKFARIKPYYDKAQVLKKESNELVEYIEDMKAELIARVMEMPKEEVLSKGMNARDLGNNLDNYDIPAQYFGTDDEKNIANGTAKVSELRKKLADYRDKLNSTAYLREKKDTAQLLLNIDTGEQKSFKEDNKVSWEMFFFNAHLPVPAALTELTKWQNNVRNAEASMLRYLYAQIGASSYKFDAIKAAIIPKSNVVFAGSNFEADIFLAAYNSNDSPEIIANGTALTEFEDGRGKFRIQASGEGEKTVSGVIKITDPLTGAIREEAFETKYQVAKPMMTISPDKMNVFYRGLENPVSISVPGVAPNQITATCSGCNEFKPQGGGKYMVKPGSGNEANINVTVKMGDGTTKNMGAMKFRVKRIPDPTIKFQGKKTGEILTTGEAKAGGALIPMLEDFDFEVYAKISSFVVSFDAGGGNIIDKSVNGNVIPPDVSALLGRIPKGKKLYFDNIRVAMPDGTTRNSAAVYTIR